MSKDTVSKGLLKLMIKLPAFRGELQIIHGHDRSLQELTEAYHDATEMLKKLYGNPAADSQLLREYEIICGDIESEVIDLCSSERQASR
jgi:hypothetical protein